MNWLDWTVIGVLGAIIMGAGLACAKRAGGNMTNFFLAGRKMPWWLACFSMIATNFGSDTPLHQAGNARKAGITNFWFYIRNVFSELCMAFFFARLWRRAKILTEIEFLELRHGSGSARVLRTVLAGYNCFLFAPFKIALFTLAMSEISKVILGIPETATFLGMPAGIMLSIGLLLFALVYSTTSGLWGVVVTDFIQMIIALVGTYAILYFVLREVGGTSGMVQKLSEMTASGELPIDVTAFMPQNWWKSVSFLLLMSPLFWLYDGDAAPIQRLMACRSEKDAMLSQVVKVGINSVLRSWPWVICGIASLLIIKEIDDVNLVYPQLIKQLMPHGLLGVLVMSFIAAFVSSSQSYLNVGTSFFMNDIYKEHIAKEKSDRHYVKVSRIALIGMAAYAIVIAVNSDNIFRLFTLLMKVMAGVGVIRVFRWYWWRVNGAAELTAIIAATTTSICFTIWRNSYEAGKIAINTPAQLVIDYFDLASRDVFSENVQYFCIDFLLITLVVTAAWLIVMFLTKPDPVEHLKEFYSRVRPPGPGWKPIAKLCPDVQKTDSLLADFGAWIVSIIFVYMMIFAVGGLYFVKYKISVICGVICVISGLLLWKKVLPRYDRLAEMEKQSEESK